MDTVPGALGATERLALLNGLGRWGKGVGYVGMV